MTDAETIPLAGGYWLELDDFFGDRSYSLRHRTGPLQVVAIAEDIKPEEARAFAAAIASVSADPAGVAGQGVSGPGAVVSRAGVYVASKAHHGPMWRDFRRAGRHIISTWIDESEKGKTTDWANLWRRCQTEAAEAQATIVYREEGEMLKGALIEVGCALTAGKPVFAVGPMDGSWHNHPSVTVCSSLDEAFALALASVAQQADAKSLEQLVSDFEKSVAQHARSNLLDHAVTAHEARLALLSHFAPTPPATAPGGAAGAVSVEDAAREVVQCAIDELQSLSDSAPRPAWDAVVAKYMTAAIRRIAAPQAEDGVRELLREVVDKGLIYWEPQTARGAAAKADMLARCENALKSPANPEKPGQEGEGAVSYNQDDTNEWMTIGTAPRDGTLVEVGADGVGSYIMRWNPAGWNDFASLHPGLWEAKDGGFTWSEDRGGGPLVWRPARFSPAPQHDGKPEVGA